MFSKVATVLGALFVATNAQVSFNPGVTSGLAISVLEQGKDAYFNAIMQKINGITIPDLVSSDGKSWMKQNYFEYDSAADHVTFSTDLVNNAIVLSCSKVTAKFWSEDFRYHYAPLLTASGRLEVDLNTIRIDVGLGFNMQVLPDGREVPVVSGQDVVVKINRFDLKISIWGSFWADTVDLIKPFIKGPLCDLIQQTLYSALDTTMPNLINKGLVKSDGFLHLTKTFELDFETPASFLVTADAFQTDIKGLFFDNVYGEVEPAVAVPVLPYFDVTKPELYQNYISTYSMDGLTTALLEETSISGWVNGSYNTTITTSMLNAFLPGILSYYGDVPVAVKYTITQLGSFSTTEGVSMINALATMTIEFWAQTATGPSLATSMTLVDTAIGFGIIVDNMTMQFALATTNVDKVVVNSCSFGKLSALLMKTELNNFFRIFTPIINKDLAAKTFTVPSNIGGIFILSNLTIGYYNNYLYFGMTPTFITPALAVEEQLAVYQ